MKITFEIDEKETILFLDIIKRFKGQTTSPELLQTLTKITDEIEDDLKIGDEIFKRLRYRLSDYTNGNAMTLDSDMRIYLGMSDNFISKPGGLEREANAVLKKIAKDNKPDIIPKEIPLSSIKDCEKISDVIHLIQNYYED